MRLTFFKISLLLTLNAILCIPCSYALSLPDDALKLLAEAQTEPCSICARQKVEKAFTLMNESLMPGHEITGDNDCLFKKTGNGNENELVLSCYPVEALKKSVKDSGALPQIVFRFYSTQNHLVGISEANYTKTPVTALFRKSPAGTAFSGQVRLILYKYGDGPTFNYFQHTNKLLIHCEILHLEPISN